MDNTKPSHLVLDDEQMEEEEAQFPASTSQESRGRKGSIHHTHPRPPPTPTTGVPAGMSSSAANPLIPSAPASPPTPAPSPGPSSRNTLWTQSSSDVEDIILRDFRIIFSGLDLKSKEACLESIVDLCDNHLLGYLHQLVSPKLKKDPFQVLPNELCFKILTFLDDPRTFVRASQVSRRWREVLGDDQAWKLLCEKHAYRRMSNDVDQHNGPFYLSASRQSFEQLSDAGLDGSAASMDARDGGFLKAAEHVRNLKRPRPRSTHRSHFKHRYLVESAWRKGGQMSARHITPDNGVVTSLHLTKKYIVVGLDNAKIHVFNTKGDHQRTLSGHGMGVWAMVPWGDILVSGGCDRDVRVWNMATGASIHALRGHTSTVRCLKMADATTAISGSRDTTLRIWDIKTGTLKNTLTGHQASVRCLEIFGDYVVSGSYDTTAKIWSISTGQCLKTLHGHFSQIYAIAFDGIRIATGSLDTSVRIWDPNDGTCRAILQGHTSLVGQLQMRGSTLVTGGSDGSVRVWSLENYTAIHRLAAHDNSVTSLQFDDTRIVSGGSDGRVKIWDLQTGTLIRELSQPAEAVWRVAFEEERSVVLASRQGRTVMEVWDFSPPDEDIDAIARPSSAPGLSKLNAAPPLEDIGMEEAPGTGSEPSTGPNDRQAKRRAARSNRESQDTTTSLTAMQKSRSAPAPVPPPAPAPEENVEMQDAVRGMALDADQS